MIYLIGILLTGITIAMICPLFWIVIVFAILGFITDLFSWKNEWKK